MVIVFLLLLILFIMVLTILDGITRGIASVILAVVIIIYVVRNWQDVLDFFATILPLLISGGVIVGIIAGIRFLIRSLL